MFRFRCPGSLQTNLEEGSNRRWILSITEQEIRDSLTSLQNIRKQWKTPLLDTGFGIPLRLVAILQDFHGIAFTKREKPRIGTVEHVLATTRRSGHHEEVHSWPAHFYKQESYSSVRSLLVAMPFVPSSVLAPSSKTRSP